MRLSMILAGLLLPSRLLACEVALVLAVEAAGPDDAKDTGHRCRAWLMRSATVPL
ncbi:hypothetical protein [uncultured Mameliella sp.]|nr:hypothetical protein [uncultured Mameliella sp.]